MNCWTASSLSIISWRSSSNFLTNFSSLRKASVVASYFKVVKCVCYVLIYCIADSTLKLLAVVVVNIFLMCSSALCNLVLNFSYSLFVVSSMLLTLFCKTLKILLCLSMSSIFLRNRAMFFYTGLNSSVSLLILRLLSTAIYSACKALRLLGLISSVILYIILVSVSYTLSSINSSSTLFEMVICCSKRDLVDIYR